MFVTKSFTSFLNLRMKTASVNTYLCYHILDHSVGMGLAICWLSGWPLSFLQIGIKT